MQTLISTSSHGHSKLQADFLEVGEPELGKMLYIRFTLSLLSISLLHHEKLVIIFAYCSAFFHLIKSFHLQHQL